MQDRRARAAAQRAVSADHHAVQTESGAGDRRGVAARRQDRLRARAARQLKQAITTARAIDPDATIMARGDSAFGTKKVIGACLDEQVEFSLTLSRNRRVTKAIDSIDETSWTPVHYPGASKTPTPRADL